MVLRKPYAFFIRHFKLFHVILSALTIYAIIRMVGVISFINNYLDSNIILITENDLIGLYDARDFIGPIIILAFNILLLTVMSLKKKPNKFYMVSTLTTIVLLVMNMYGYSTIKALTEVWLDVTRVGMLSDMYIFVMMACVVMGAMYISRAIGFNISRFDFNNDILQFELSEEDNAEFELMVDFDVNDMKRTAQKRFRYLKYFIKENRSAIITCVGVVVITILVYLGFTYVKYSKDVIKGSSLTYNGFTLNVNGTYIINEDFKGNELADNKHLLVVDANITNNSFKDPTKFITGTLSISIGDNSYSTTNRYENLVTDLGQMYADEKIKLGETVRRVLVFEVPKSHLSSKILLGTRDLSNKSTTYINLKTNDLTTKESKKVEIKLKEEVKLDDSTIDNTKIKIDSYEVSNKFKVNYKYCISDNNCINSIEYLVPDNSNSNYDRTLLKLTGTFEFNGKNLIDDFYELFLNFGYIEYTIKDKTYIQNTGFRQVKSSKVKQSNTYYLEVLSDIKNADNIVLGFKIRNVDYRYYLVKESN